jgi:hypothetical protein
VSRPLGWARSCKPRSLSSQSSGQCRNTENMPTPRRTSSSVPVGASPTPGSHSMCFKAWMLPKRARTGLSRAAIPRRRPSSLGFPWSRQLPAQKRQARPAIERTRVPEKHSQGLLIGDRGGSGLLLSLESIHCQHHRKVLPERDCLPWGHRATKNRSRPISPALYRLIAWLCDFCHFFCELFCKSNIHKHARRI